jgi:Na+-translocating ferredoxin:NAD+ oxidoreductase RNF subunit RnfB
MNLILISMGVLGVTALLAAVLLYVVSLFFKVEEDPRIDLVTAVLPGANCGGCGFAGCRAFAEACVKAGGIEGLACPVGGEPTMDEVKKVLTPSSDEPAAASSEPAEGGKKGFDPAVAAKIKALPTPKAAFPAMLRMAQKAE